MRNLNLLAIVLVALVAASCTPSWGPLAVGYAAEVADCGARQVGLIRDGVGARPGGELFTLNEAGTQWVGNRGTVAAGRSLEEILGAWAQCLVAQQVAGQQEASRAEIEELMTSQQYEQLQQLLIEMNKELDALGDDVERLKQQSGEEIRRIRRKPSVAVWTTD